MAVRDRVSILTLSAVLVVAAFGCAGSAADMEIGAQPTQAMEEIERTKQAASETEGAELSASPTDVEAAPVEPAEPVATEPSTQPAAVDATKPVHFPTANPEGKRTQKPTLFEASEAERLRRQASTDQPSTIIITDANLGEYAKGGQMTELVTEKREEGETPSAATGSAAASDDEETYWRTRVRDSRLAWRAAADRVEDLKGQVAKLRHDFYAEDDPAYRDLEIKPAWDRTAVELTQAQLRVGDLENQVQLLLAEGFEAGALPGWLREGLEFEPEPSEEAKRRPNELGVAEAIEPPIMDDPPR